MDEIWLPRLRAISNEILTLSNLATEQLLTITTNESYQAEVTKNKLTQRLSRLASEMNNYFRFSNNPSADDISQISEIQLKAEDVLSELTTKLTWLTKNKQDQDNNLSMATSSRLPKLSLAEFDGDILRWHQFWDQFQSSIHERSIPDVEKLLYLQASVKGEAKKLIEGFETTNRNYTIALEALKNRYAKTNFQIDAHYAALSKLVPARKDTASQRNVLNEIERHVRILESLGEDINHNHLRYLIVSKFPGDLVYELKLKSKDGSITEVRHHLESIINAREETRRMVEGMEDKSEDYSLKTLHTIQDYRTNQRGQRRLDTQRQEQPFRQSYRNSHFKEPYQSRNRGQEGRTRRGHNEFTNGEPPIKRRGLPCIFCDRPHDSDICRQYRSISERKGQLRRRCYRCLRLNHRAKDCKVSVHCIHCGMRNDHHRIICPQRDLQHPNGNSSNQRHGGPTFQTTNTHVALGPGDTIKPQIKTDASSSGASVSLNTTS